jgi:uncharacterized membrane protein
MAQNSKQEPWLLLTIAALAAVMALFYVFLFPDESLRFIGTYWHWLLPVLVTIVVALVAIIAYRRIKEQREQKTQLHRDRQIKLVEQLIWRSRYSLESQKSQILMEDTPENRAQWQTVKLEYIRTKIFPVVSEKDVPVKLASTLIEQALSGSQYRSGRLPTYRVQNL